MTVKPGIVERLGETAVLLPALIGEALAANDRIKLRLSLLQEAALRARAPHGDTVAAAVPDAGGLGDPELDSLVAGARLVGPGRLFLPGIGLLVAGLEADLAAMLAPLEAADAEAARPFAERAEMLRRGLPAAEGEQLETAEIDALCAARRGGRDSLHLLVMDLHKALNRLAAETAVEELDGARVHALEERDRQAVRAFMCGLNRTAPLAFGHPGLGTTAVRAGGRLTIQNDIGTTDAHVLVVHLDPGAVSVTYTDVHRPRAKFFLSLFEDQAVSWSPLAEQSGTGFSEEVFYLVTGRCASDEPSVLDRFLEFLGSRIVFLIDWNKARKALQTFVGKNVAIELLTWSARQDFGHRAFLALGGADLIFEAVHRTAAGRIPYGVRLDEALGAAECQEFLQQVLRDTSQGLAAGRTTRLIRDEIQADLARRFETAESSVFTVLVRHLGLSRLLAGAIADLLATPQLADAARRRAFAARAKRIEEKADLMTLAAREVSARLREAAALRPVIDEIENTADALEDCAFLLSLAPEPEAAALGAGPLLRLAEIAADSVGQLVRAVEAASRLPDGQRADAVAALQSIDAVILAERSADAAERDAYAAFMAVPAGDARALVLGLEIARALETATDHLSHAALALRDRVLGELSA
ncbi:hypothetical protein SAMN06265365_1079 [Tistlia consotensis]|uniref:Phosphate transport regulator n=1 Tax=Tistlia consotensis USBA 355 TaxID=560819 RepID=A0A1Y6B775_9PROT|nr:hypothetical protein [Tistlia consotensis]SME96652.1 hypothetical protein SAMN05428998_1029 [Tistlia consotensis USBA 355]SNR55982.1 hypothetical protein SAMN06265365_1079 [Tistlia consotensis]